MLVTVDHIEVGQTFNFIMRDGVPSMKDHILNQVFCVSPSHRKLKYTTKNDFRMVQRTVKKDLLVHVPDKIKLIHTLKDYLHLYMGAMVSYPVRNESPIARAINKLDPALLAYLYIINQWKDVKVYLRPLHSITEDEAVKICKIAAPVPYGDYRFSKWTAVKDGEWSNHSKYFDITNPKSDYSFVLNAFTGVVSLYDAKGGDVDMFERLSLNNAYWIWYLQNHFDIPVTQDNKTLIEIGLAEEVGNE